MANQTVAVDDLASVIVALVGEYTDDVKAAIPAVLDTEAAAAVTDLRARSPKRTGGYAKGWRVKKHVSKTTGTESRVIYNATDYQLTHLLELGHAKVNGGRVSAIPHIGPVAEAHGAKLAENLARVVVGGGR